MRSNAAPIGLDAVPAELRFIARLMSSSLQPCCSAKLTAIAASDTIASSAVGVRGVHEKLAGPPVIIAADRHREAGAAVL
jgi:hypothetical protein